MGQGVGAVLGGSGMLVWATEEFDAAKHSAVGRQQVVGP